jgi:sarcosine oxidase
MKIAVVGLGAIGSQVLWQLSRIPGVEVHGYDTNYPGHSAAGAGGDNRIFWNLELAELDYAPLIVRAAELWKELEEASRAPLRTVDGVLVFGEPGTPQLETSIASAELTGASIELLDNGQLRQRFPQFGVEEDTVGVWDVGGAVIRPELTIATAARLAAENGAVVHEFTRVSSIDVRDDGIDIGIGDAGTGGFEHFDRVIVACGGWTPQLLPELKSEVLAMRLTTPWYFGADGGEYTKGIPTFIRTAPHYCYGIPSADGTSVKVGLGFNDHIPTGDPDTLTRHLAGEELEAEIRKFDWIVDRMLPGLEPKPYRLHTCVESYTTSMMEYVRFHPESTDLVVMTGFSGHGFRVAPAMGEIGAELALRGRSTIDVDFLQRADPVFSILDPETGLTTRNEAFTTVRGVEE